MVGKVLAIIIIMVVLVGGGFYIGQNYGKFNPQKASSTASQSASISPNPVVSSPTPSPTVSPTPQSVQTQQAGGFGNYGSYSISVPTSWKTERTQNNSQDLLTVSNGDYQLQIDQLNGGASPCIYPGDSPTPMSQTFTSFISFGTAADPNLYRRGKSQIPYQNGEDQYVVCQKISGVYDTNTTFGSIYYMAPKNPDESILAQMDAIFQSIKAK